MQQVQQRELSERMSWARALIFAVGFFFISAILIGQLPSVIYADISAASLESFEKLCLSVGVVCLASFVVVQVIVLLFDPKPLVPPRAVIGLGAILGGVGLLVAVLSTTTGCVYHGSMKDFNPTTVLCNQYFPTESTSIAPVLGGKFLWFQPHAIDLVMIGLAILGVGLAMVFYGVLAQRELTDPDRRDLGTTPAIRTMTAVASVLLIAFLLIYYKLDPTTFGTQLISGHPFVGFKIVQLVMILLLGSAILLGLGAFALRLHYLMRPVRKNTMSALYAVGALGLAQTGAIFILLWIIIYPLLALIHPLTFIGLGDYLTNCSRPADVPASCALTQDGAAIVATIFTSAFFGLMLAAVWAWKTKRNLVVVGSVVTIAVIAVSALLSHTEMAQLPTAMMLTVGILILAVVLTAVSRRAFAVLGQNTLGCLGMWLITGSCLTIYLLAFAFFSIPSFAPEETPPNIPFAPGGTADAFVMIVVMGILAAVQFYFLVRNRYKI